MRKSTFLTIFEGKKLHSSKKATICKSTIILKTKRKSTFLMTFFEDKINWANGT